MRSVLPILCVGGAAACVFVAAEVAPSNVWTSPQSLARAADVSEPEPQAQAHAATHPKTPKLAPVPSGWADIKVAPERVRPRRKGKKHDAKQTEDAEQPEPEELSVVFAAPALPPAQPPLPEGGPLAWQGRYPGPSDELRASAYAFNARVLEAPYRGASTLAIVRRGSLLEVTGRANGHGCRNGRWFSVAPAGYICTRRGFGVYDWDKRFGRVGDAPDVTRGLPYHYGKLLQQGAPRMRHVPSAQEWERIQTELSSDSHADLPDVVASRLRGAYFFALAAEETTSWGSFLHTVRGRVLPREAVQRLGPTRMRGEKLVDNQPVAFVVADPAKVYDVETGRESGLAERYSRFAIEGQVQRDDVTYVRAPGDRMVAIDDVRRVRVVPRPGPVGADERWVHIDLPQQVLVAYEGDRPVFATLVASGIEGHRTPAGLFRVREKHITATMRGPDPDMGVYEVEEVPWTQYFHYSYAIHGAYWHDGFGAVRSHGCVNLPPDDARWLFEWTAPSVPKPWHGRRKLEGTWIYSTRG